MSSTGSSRLAFPRSVCQRPQGRHVPTWPSLVDSLVVSSDGQPRVGVFGGTFDPPHLGHLVAAVNVRHALALDVVLFVVANVPWQKVESRLITDAETRYSMVADAVAGTPGLEASRIEIERGGQSYTADTVAELRASMPGADLHLILGQDAARGLPTWERVEEIRSAVTVAVVDRPGEALPPPLPGWRWTAVPVPAIGISSSEIRARVADGRPLEFLLPPAVVGRIRSLDLYGYASC
ncbi:MAG: nadD [Acidimicrobiia bacterium]|nr:nadD [Acidimicrobiia bacterium]